MNTSCEILATQSETVQYARNTHESETVREITRQSETANAQVTMLIAGKR
jgi:hypothetical protein